MRLYWFVGAVGFCAVFFFYLLTRYANTSPLVQEREQFCVVCTTTIIADAVRAIGGDRICTITLMGPGVDPHLYRAREGDVHRIAGADLVLYHGLHLEGKLADLFEGMQAYVPTVAVSDRLETAVLRSAEVAGLYDPHVWHDINLWMVCVERVRDALVQHNPTHAADYMANAKTYIAELRTLDLWVHEQMDAVPRERRILVTAHDAFSYFGHAYGLEVVALQGISTESDVGTRDIIDLVQYIVSHKVPVMFVESSVPARAIHAVQQATEARGWLVKLGDSLYSDSLSDKKSGADTYVRMMHHNVCAVISGLMRRDQLELNG
jgi:manganese/zinc/iron transport system substrate-binding protein